MPASSSEKAKCAAARRNGCKKPRSAAGPWRDELRALEHDRARSFQQERQRVLGAKPDTGADSQADDIAASEPAASTSKVSQLSEDKKQALYRKRLANWQRKQEQSHGRDRDAGPERER